MVGYPGHMGEGGRVSRSYGEGGRVSKSYWGGW